MPGPYTREKIENWVGDFCGSDAIGDFSTGAREYAGQLLVTFLVGACEVRDIEPEDLEESDLKPALLKLAKLQLPTAVRTEVPALCGAFLTALEDQGRLGGGRVMGAYVRALKDAFAGATPGA